VSLLNFFLIVAALSLAGIAIALVPTLLQLKRTAEKAELLLETLNRDVSPLLQTLAETAGELRSLTAAINEKVDKADTAIENIQDTTRLIRSTAFTLKQSMVPLVSSIGGLGAGISTFVHYFTRSGKN
jgi:uncharacterized protein YoxC